MTGIVSAGICFAASRAADMVGTMLEISLLRV